MRETSGFRCPPARHLVVFTPDGEKDPQDRVPSRFDDGQVFGSAPHRLQCPLFQDGSLLVDPVPGCTFCQTDEKTFLQLDTTLRRCQGLASVRGFGFPLSVDTVSLLPSDGEGIPRVRVHSRLDEDRSFESAPTSPV